MLLATNLSSDPNTGSCGWIVLEGCTCPCMTAGQQHMPSGAAACRANQSCDAQQQCLGHGMQLQMTWYCLGHGQAS